MKNIHIHYYALLREQAGTGEETLSTTAATPAELYAQIRVRHGLSLDQEQLRAVINEEFCDWSATLEDGDRVVFIPPVAGG